LSEQAVSKGVTIALNTPVKRILFNIDNKTIEGVEVSENINIKSPVVVTNCDLYTTYFKLMNENERIKALKSEHIQALEKIDYTSPVIKINLIVSKLPEFKCLRNLYNTEEEYNNRIAPNYLTGTIHMNADSIEDIDTAYIEALSGKFSSKPIIEMTIPSVYDKTLVPPNSNHHVIGLFCQYAPKLLKEEWNDKIKKEYTNRIYEEIDKYCPGFSDTILFEDILTPNELENEFSIRGGNIFHGSMELSSIFFCRPFPSFSSYKHPITGLYSCSSAMHPGGGVMGASGRNCAYTILNKSLL
jgi:phytoene dehydrogenase-like protein